MNKNIIITGGSSGIGLSTVKKLLQENYNVLVFDKTNTDELKKLNVDFIACDLLKPADIENGFAIIKSNYSSIYGLINNAGILSYGNVEELAIEDWDKVMNINVRAAFLCAKFAIPMMNKGGIVINMASVQSFYAQAKVTAYATSKAALLGLTRAIAIDYAGKVRCISVCPGTIDTPMLHNALTQSETPDEMLKELNDTHLTKRIGKPEEVAELLAFLCSEKCQFITGTEIRVDGGLGVNLGGSIN